MKVFVIGPDRTPLMPMNAAKARKLLKQKKAVVVNHGPFCIQILFTPESTADQPVRAGIDYGAKEAGIAIVQERSKKQNITLLTGIISVANDIARRMEIRRSYRRARRSRLRYRKPRYDNRVRVKCHICGRNANKGQQTCKEHRDAKPEGKVNPNIWLPPSAKARKDSITRVVKRLLRWIPIKTCLIQTGRFDTQKLSRPNIDLTGYQQGPVYNRDIVKAALIFEYGRREKEEDRVKIIPRCCYCDKEGVALEIEHIIPKAKGGRNNWPNLTLACKDCNNLKGDKTPAEANMTLLYKPQAFYLSRVFKHALSFQQGKNYLANSISSLGIPCSFTYGQFTSWQRKRFGIDKTSCNDSVLIAATVYDSELKPRLPITKVRHFNIKPMPTKRRKIFNASSYSPYKGIPKGFSREATVDFGYTLKTLTEVNKACVMIREKARLVPKAIKLTGNIPDNVVLILKKGDIVHALYSGKKVTGRVSSLMSNGTIKIAPVNQKKQIKISLKNISRVLRGSSVVFV